MSEIKKQEKTCKNCEHYVAHYVIDNSHFIKIEGHCANDTLRKLRKQFRLQANCEYWEEKKVTNKRQESIKATLRSMKRSLDEIKAILENEDKDLS